MTLNSKHGPFFAIAVAIFGLCDCAPYAMAQGTPAASGGTVYVSRPQRWAASALRMNIYVNDKRVGSIGDGQCAKVTLPAGRHRVHGQVLSVLGSLFDSRTETVQVNVSPDSATFVSVTPTLMYPGQYILYPIRVSSTGRRC